ncbi:MAG: type III-A CRISPR-associated protein Csm2 [Candidatus Micrarchaeaceae archaeon]
MHRNNDFSRERSNSFQGRTNSNEIDKMISYIQNGGDEFETFKIGGVVHKFVNNPVEGKGSTATSQLRKFYDELLEVKLKDKYRLMRILLNATYAKARNHLKEQDYTFIRRAIENILSSDNNQEQRLERFKHIFEAVIAYYALKEAEKSGRD